jgi:hypothetical protein
MRGFIVWSAGFNVGAGMWATSKGWIGWAVFACGLVGTLLVMLRAEFERNRECAARVED